jgi:hypothetical protein
VGFGGSRRAIPIPEQGINLLIQGPAFHGAGMNKKKTIFSMPEFCFAEKIDVSLRNYPQVLIVNGQVNAVAQKRWHSVIPQPNIQIPSVVGHHQIQIIQLCQPPVLSQTTWDTGNQGIYGNLLVISPEKNCLGELVGQLDQVLNDSGWIRTPVNVVAQEYQPIATCWVDDLQQSFQFFQVSVNVGNRNQSHIPSHI